MPVAAFNASDFLHLQGDAWGPEQLHDYFRARPNSRELDAWLLSLLKSPSERAQLLLRTARAAQSFEHLVGQPLSLLIGVPLVVQSAATTKKDPWFLPRIELESGLAYQLGWQVRMCAHPVAVSTLHAAGATCWRAWRDALSPSSSAPDPSLTTGERPSGPCVWVGHLIAPDTDLEKVDSLLMRMNPELGRSARTLLMRLEGLLEEQGVGARMFPPTAAWNALSFARAAHARMTLGSLAAGWVLVRRPGGLDAQSPEGQTIHLEFPEELDADLEGLCQWFQARQPPAEGLGASTSSNS